MAGRTKEVELDQLGALYRHDFDYMVELGVDAMHKAALLGEVIVAQDTPTDTGNTKARWHVVRMKDGADLVNDSPVAGILEGGSRPHRPPLEPILRWVVRVMGIDLKGGRRSYEDIEDVPDETVGVAWAICENIAANGTEPHWMVKDNLDKLAELAKAVVEKKLKKANDGAGGSSDG